MSERRTLQTRGEVIEEYSRDFPAEIVEIYSRPLPGAVEPVPTEPTPRPRRKKRRVWKGLLILLAVAAVIALLAAGVLCAALPAAALAEENTASIQTQVSETDEDIPWAD